MNVELTKWICYECAGPYSVRGFPSETVEQKDYSEAPQKQCEQCGEMAFYLMRYKILSNPEIQIKFVSSYRHFSSYHVRISGQWIYGHPGWSFDPVRLEYTGFGPKTYEECLKEGYNVHSEEDAQWNFIKWNNTVHFSDGDTLISDDLFEACKLYFNPDIKRAIFKSEWEPDDDPENILHQKQVNCRVEYY